MNQNKFLSLLQTRRFLPLFICQFCSALKNNFLRTILVAIITFKSSEISDFWRSIFVSLSFGISTLPYVIFSATAGELADKYDKSKIIQIIKSLDFLFVFIIILGIYTNNYALTLFSAFLTGFEAAALGPVKYSILPEQLTKDELLPANSLIEASTFLAILFGIILGGMLYGGSNIWIFGFLILISIVGYFASKLIPSTISVSPNLQIGKNIFKQSFNIVKAAKNDSHIFKLIIIISWFWLAGGIFLGQLPNFVKDVLKSDQTVFMLLLTIFTSGIAVGSLICYKISNIGMKHSLGALLASSVVTAILWYFSNNFNYANLSSLMTFSEFIFHRSSWLVGLAMFFIAIFWGMFIVPIYVLLQKRSKNEERSRMIAANNIINSIFIVAGSLSSTFLIWFGFYIQDIFLIIAIANLYISWYGFSLTSANIENPSLKSVG